MGKMINVRHFLQAWLPIEQQTRIKMGCFQYIRNMVKGAGKKKNKTFHEDEDWVNYLVTVTKRSDKWCLRDFVYCRHLKPVHRWCLHSRPHCITIKVCFQINFYKEISRRPWAENLPAPWSKRLLRRKRFPDEHQWYWPESLRRSLHIYLILFPRSWTLSINWWVLFFNFDGVTVRILNTLKRVAFNTRKEALRNEIKQKKQWYLKITS